MSARRWRPVVALSVLVVVALMAGSAAGQAADPQAQRDQVRTQRAQVAGQVDALQADDATVTKALDDIDQNVAAQQAQLDDARRASLEATQRAFQAQAAADEQARRVDALRVQMRAVAVDAYVDPPGHDLLDRFKAADATEAAEKRALLETRTTSASDLVDQMRAAKRQLDQDQAQATQAAADATDRAHEAESRLAEYQQARQQQQQFASGVEERLNAKLAEAAALTAVDADLAAQITAQQRALVQQVKVAVGPGPVPDTPAGPATDGPPTTTPPPTTPPPVTPPPITRPPLQTVGGITVAASIASQVGAMLDAARADGIVLGGSGYRDPSAQIELRRQHCGTSDYAIYQMPAMECVPPTAIPGTSMHEKGLAIDFTYNGRAIIDHANPAYVWLAANAGRFGFVNLPSEPWHWSTTGR